jgi:glycosyltransferase involved in cell wall biosynthesis
VIIPSRGRRSSLVRLLRALDAQEYPGGRFEVIVALDGDVDGSAAAIAGAALACEPHVVLLHAPSRGPDGNGAGVARNRGADVASGDVLLFLDDDVLPWHPQVLLEHGLAHARQPDAAGAAVGPCPARLESLDGYFAHKVRVWSVDNVRRLLTGAHLGFTDVCTGNLSVHRRAFAAAGGFRRMARREDWDLGYRLVLAGTPLWPLPEAPVIHEADLRVGNAIADRHREGAGDIAFARMHPRAASWLPISGWPTMSRAERLAIGVVFPRPSAVVSVLQAVRPVLWALEALGLREQYSALLGAAYRLSYWSGVAAAAGSRAAWLDLADLIRTTGSSGAPLDLLADEVTVHAPGLDGQVEVVAGDVILGRAWYRWGGVPWSADAFAAAVAHHFAGAAVGAELRRRATARSTRP